jgi:hypothetical protein
MASPPLKAEEQAEAELAARKAELRRLEVRFGSFCIGIFLCSLSALSALSPPPPSLSLGAIGCPHLLADRGGMRAFNPNNKTLCPPPPPPLPLTVDTFMPSC